MLLQHIFANVAQLVERVHGKDEVSGSIPDIGSNAERTRLGTFCYDSVDDVTPMHHPCIFL